MTETGGLEEAILLRLIDRLVTAEQQIATSLATIGALSDSVADLRNKIAALTKELDDMREITTAAARSFEQMRSPLQGLLDLKQKLSGGWLVVMAVFMAIAYLLQPLLEHLYRWRLDLK